MKFLKDRRAFRRWAARIERGQSVALVEPERYPCIGYQVVADWGMEWTDARYLYISDIRHLNAQMERAHKIAP
jgi:hypothetical protein